VISLKHGRKLFGVALGFWGAHAASRAGFGVLAETHSLRRAFKKPQNSVDTIPVIQVKGCLILGIEGS
jgi:hypothetical protein